MKTNNRQPSKYINVNKFIEFLKKEHQPLSFIISCVALICSIVIPIISICNFKSNLRIAENNFNQSFRPIGTIKHRGEFIVVNFLPKSDSSFNFCYRPYIHNTGNGILSYIGHICFTSKEEIDFKKMYLSGKIQDVLFDKMFSYARSSYLNKNDSLCISICCESDSFFSPVFLNCLAFYQDQNGNLYDTEYLLFIRFVNRFTLEKNELSNWENNIRTNKYSKKDMKILKKRLERSNSNIYELLFEKD